MVIVQPDFDRRIDLPGAGPCPRPVDIDRTRADLTRLVSLRVYSFARGVAIDGEAEGDEVFIVLMRGAAAIVVEQGGAVAGAFVLEEEAGVRAVYLPPRAAYRLTAVGDCDIAYARCRPRAATMPGVRGFAPAAGRRLEVADHATGMAMALSTLSPGIAEAVAGAPERFVHVRADDDGAVRIADMALRDWMSAILLDGAAATAQVEGKAAILLTINATTT